MEAMAEGTGRTVRPALHSHRSKVPGSGSWRGEALSRDEALDMIGLVLWDHMWVLSDVDHDDLNVCVDCLVVLGGGNLGRGELARYAKAFARALRRRAMDRMKCE